MPSKIVNTHTYRGTPYRLKAWEVALYVRSGELDEHTAKEVYGYLGGSEEANDADVESDADDDDDDDDDGDDSKKSSKTDSEVDGSGCASKCAACAAGEEKEEEDLIIFSDKEGDFIRMDVEEWREREGYSSDDFLSRDGQEFDYEGYNFSS